MHTSAKFKGHAQEPTAVGAGALTIMQLIHLLDGGFGFSRIPQIVCSRIALV